MNQEIIKSKKVKKPQKSVIQQQNQHPFNQNQDDNINTCDACWNQCCKDFCCCCCLIFCPTILDDDQNNIYHLDRPDRNNYYTIFIYFQGIYSQFSSLQVLALNIFHNQNISDSKLYEEFQLSKITNNLGYIRFKYHKMESFKLKAKHFIGSFSESELIQYDYQGDQKPQFVCPEEFLPVNCNNQLLSCFRGAVRTDQSREDRFSNLALEIINCPTVVIKEACGCNNQYVLKLLINMLNDQRNFEILRSDVQSLVAQNQIGKDTPLQTLFKYVQIIGLNDKHSIQNDCAITILESFFHIQDSQLTNSTINGIAVAFKSCIGKAAFLVFRYRSLFIQQNIEYQFNYEEFVTKNKLNIIDIGLYSQQFNFFQYLTEQEVSQLHEYASQQSSQTLFDMIKFCSAFSYPISQSYFETKFLQQLTNMIDWNSFFLFWNENSHCILGQQLPNIIMQNFEKSFESEFQKNYALAPVVEKVLFQISVLDTMNRAYSQIPQIYKENIYNKKLKDIQDFINENIFDLRNDIMPDENINVLKDNQIIKQSQKQQKQQQQEIQNEKGIKLNMELQPIQQQKRIPFLKKLQQCIVLLNPISTKNFCQQKEQQKLIDQIFQYIEELIQDNNILGNPECTPYEVIGVKKNIKSDVQGKRFRDLFETKIYFENKNIEINEKFVNNVTTHCLDSNFIIKSEDFNEYYGIFLNILTDRLPQDMSYMILNEYLHKVLLSCQKSVTYQKHKFFLNLYNRGQQFYKDLSNDRIDLGIALNLLENEKYKLVEKVFTIIGINTKKNEIKTYAQFVSNISEWKEKVKAWLVFHGNSRDMPQYLKKLTSTVNLLAIKDVPDIIKEVEKYNYSIEFLNYASNIKIFKYVLETFSIKLQNQTFKDIEYMLKNLIFVKFHSICSAIYRYQNSLLNIDFGLKNSPYTEIAKQFELDLKNKNQFRNNNQNENFKIVDYRLLRSFFSIQNYKTLDELNIDLHLMNGLYLQYFQCHNIFYSQQFSTDVFTYLDIDNAKQKAKCIKKISKLFILQNNKQVEQYQEFLQKIDKIGDDTPLQDVILGSKDVHQTLSQLQAGLTMEDFIYLIEFTQASKTIKFMIHNRNTNFDEIGNMNDELDKNLEQSADLMSKYGSHIKHIYDKIMKNKKKSSFTDLCKILVKEIKDKMQISQSFFYDLSQVNQYINQIKDIIDGPQVKTQKVQIIIAKLLEKGQFVIEVKPGQSDLFTINEQEKLFSKDMTNIYTKAFLVTIGTAQEALEKEKILYLQKVKQFKEQVELLQEVKDIIDQLRALGNFQFQNFKVEFSNKNGYETCMGDINHHKNVFQIEIKSWVENLNNCYRQYPLLTLIPQRLLSVFLELIFKKNLSPSDNEEVTHLLSSLAVGIDYKNFKFSNQEIQIGMDNLKRIQVLGEFLTENLQNFIQIRKTLNQEPKIYIQRILHSQQHQVYIALEQAFTKDSRSFQYFFCDKNTTYHDLMLFINRFLNLHICSYFYLVDFQNCSVSLRTQISEKLFTITKNKIMPSNNTLIIFSLIQNQSDRMEMQQYDQYLAHIQGEIPKKITDKVFTYYSLYGGLETLAGDDPQPIQAIHLQITDSKDIHDLNLILFELLVLRFINANYTNFTFIDPEIEIHIEIQNTLNESLASGLKVLDIFKNRQMLSFDLNSIQIKNTPKSKIQTVLRYLRAILKGATKECDYGQRFIDIPQLLPIIEKKDAIELLRTFFLKKFNDAQKVIKSPNYYTLMHFIRFLSKQLNGLDSQPIFNLFLDGETLNLYFGGLDEAIQIRYNLIILLYELAFIQAYEASGDLFSEQGKEIAKLKGKNIDDQQSVVAGKVKKYKELQTDFVAFTDDGIPVCCYLQGEMPEQLKHAYKALKDRSSTEDTDMPDWHVSDQFKLTKHLVKLCNKNPSSIIQNQNALTFEESKMQKKLRDELESIAISSDNFFKMALIYLRTTSKTPTITMGETGIGKTAVVKLLSFIMNYEFLILDVHAGVGKETIISTVERGERLCADNNNKVVLFFDEINTNTNISGLLKEILLDRRLEGRKIDKRLLLLAACNPYKKKKPNQQNFTAGIKLNKLDEENQLLVYRVEPMPQSMFYFIQNYDTLDEKDLQFYIRKILVRENLFRDHEIDNLITQQVFASQLFVNSVDSPQSCSLRDVVRFAKLCRWFIKVYYPKKDIAQETINQADKNQQKLRAIILSLDFCYHNRLINEKQREQYRKQMVNIFTKNVMLHCFKEINFISNGDMLYAALEDEANFLLDCVSPPKDFGRNQALKENIFAMFVSIYNKIPLFLTGPPGCSKTSSFNLIYKCLHKGSGNRNPFLRQFPNIQLRQYQGHLQSTSQNVERVFKDALALQKDCQQRNLDTLVVVFIDELGLAELSPHNPLKILHSILENPEVSVIGISNWTLDASKQNRALSLSRDYASQTDLIVTAESIVETMKVIIDKEYIQKIVDAFLKILEQTKQNIPELGDFFGNRDFYNMIKCICSEWNIAEEKFDVIVKGFYRNFSGHHKIEKIVYEILFNLFKNTKFVKPSVTTLIRENLNECKQLYPTRHLLIFTDDEEGAINYIESQFQNKCKVFFGSDFQEDKFESSTNSTINEIVVCIETGIPCIVINFESIYQSFYAMLNQNYIEIRGGEVKMCTIAYGYDKRKIIVHPKFKFVLIAKLEDRKRLDPPLLNRFEKHEYTRQNLLKQDELEILQEIMNWSQMFCFEHSSNNIEGEQNLFLNATDNKKPGLQKQKNLQIGGEEAQKLQNKFSPFCCDDLEGAISSIIDFNKNMSSFNQTQEQLLQKCKEDLIWITHFGGIMRTQDQKIIKTYIQQQKHQNLEEFITWANQQCKLNLKTILPPQNSNSHINPAKKYEIQEEIQIKLTETAQEQPQVINFDNWCGSYGFSAIIYTFQNVSIELLQRQRFFEQMQFAHRSLETFSSEKELDQYLEQYFLDYDSGINLLILSAQIHTTDSHERILVTRNRITQNRKKQKKGMKHVCLILKMKEQTCEMLRFSNQWLQLSVDNLYDCFINAKEILKNQEEIEKVNKILILDNLIEQSLSQILSDNSLIKYFLMQDNTFGKALSLIDYNSPNEQEKVQTHVQEVIKIFKNFEQNSKFLNLIITRMNQYINAVPNLKDQGNNQNWHMLVFKTGDIFNSMSYHKALINYIEKLVINALSSILFELEKLNLLEPYYLAVDYREILFFQKIEENVLKKPIIVNLQQVMKLSGVPLPIMIPFFEKTHNSIMQFKQQWKNTNCQIGNLQNMVESVFQYQEIEFCKNKIFLPLLLNDICVYSNKTIFKHIQFYQSYKILVHQLQSYNNAFVIYEIIWEFEDFLQLMSEFFNNMIKLIPYSEIQNILLSQKFINNQQGGANQKASGGGGGIFGFFKNNQENKNNSQNNSEKENKIIDKVNSIFKQIAAFYYSRLLPIEENLRAISESRMSYEFYADVYLRFHQKYNLLNSEIYLYSVKIILNFYVIVCRPLQIDLKILATNQDLFQLLQNYQSQNNDRILELILRIDYKNKLSDIFLKEFTYWYVTESINQQGQKGTAVRKIFELFNADCSYIPQIENEKQQQLIAFNYIMYGYFDQIKARSFLVYIQDDVTQDKILNTINQNLTSMRIPIEHEISLVITHNIEMMLQKKYRIDELLKDFLELNYLEVISGALQSNQMQFLIAISAFRVIAQMLAAYVGDLILQQTNYLFGNIERHYVEKLNQEKKSIKQIEITTTQLSNSENQKVREIYNFVENRLKKILAFFNTQSQVQQNKSFRGFLIYVMKLVYMLNDKNIEFQIKVIQTNQKLPSQENQQLLVWIQKNFKAEISINYPVSSNPWRVVAGFNNILFNYYTNSLLSKNYSFLDTINTYPLHLLSLTLFHSNNLVKEEDQLEKIAKEQIKQRINQNLSNESPQHRIISAFVNQFDNQFFLQFKNKGKEFLPFFSLQNQKFQQVKIFLSFFSTLVHSENYFSTVILSPKDVIGKNIFIPFMIKNLELFTIDMLLEAQNGVSDKQAMSRLSRYKCKCGYIFVISNCGQTVEDYHEGEKFGANRGKCPECGSEIGNKEGGQYGQKADGIIRIDEEPIMKDQKARNNTDQQKGYILIDSLALKYSHYERKLNSLSFRIGHLFLHAALLMVYLVNDPSKVNLRELVDLVTNFDQVFEILFRHITYDWDCIKQILNISDDQMLYLMSYLIDSINNYSFSNSEAGVVHDLSVQKYNFTNAEQRELFEINFSKLFVDKLKHNEQIFQVFYQMDKNQIKESEINQLSIHCREGISKELISQKENIQIYLPNQMRKTIAVSLDAIVNQIALLNMEVQVPYIQFLFSKKKELDYLYQCGWVFVNFYQKVHNLFTRQLSRQEINNKTIYSELQALGAQDVLSDMETFVNLWNEQSKNGMQINIAACTIVQLPYIEAIQDVKISLFLMRKGTEEGNYFYKLLENFQYRQNVILNEIYQISSQQKSHSEWIQGLLGGENQKQIKSLPMHKIQQQHILKSWDIDSPQSFCIPGLYYSKGNQLYSDLIRFERELICDILRDKVYIDFDKSAIFEYKMEMSAGFISDMLEFISFVEQEQPDANSLGQILKKIENIEEGYNLLQDLVSCVRILKNIGGSNEKMLISVLKEFSLIRKTDKRKEELLKNFRLKHIKFIIDCVEESILDKLVQLCLPCYKQKLDENDKTGLKNLFINTQSIDVKICSTALGRYIVRLLSSEADPEAPDNKIFSELFQNNDIIPGIEELFPESVKIYLQDMSWLNASEKVQLQKAKALSAYEFLKQNQEEIIREKQKNFNIIDQKVSKPQFANELQELNQKNPEELCKIQEPNENIAELNQKKNTNYDFMTNSKIKEKQMTESVISQANDQQQLYQIQDDNYNVDQLETLPTISIIKLTKQNKMNQMNQMSQQKNTIIQPNFGDIEENIIHDDDEDSIQPPQYEEYKPSSARQKQRENLSKETKEHQPLPNIAKQTNIVPQLSETVLQVIKKYGEYVPKLNIEKFNECYQLPPYEFEVENYVVFDEFEFQKNKIGDIYIGQWRKGKRWGLGKLYLSDGGYYYGYWNNDKMSMQGRFIYQTGDMYEGQMDENKANGKGKMCYYEQGIEFQGDFQNDQRHGQGILKWNNGSVYQGEFKKNQLCGYGKYSFPDQRVYEGNFFENKYNGQGTFTWSNGKKYIGNYKNYMKHGYGEFYWPDGTVFKGQWENNKRHGKGVIIQNGVEKTVQFDNDNQVV